MMREQLIALSPLARTAWNDACCRAEHSNVCNDAMASWLVDAFGNSPAFAKLDPLVSVGVAARRRAFDRLMQDVQDYFGPSIRYEVWLLGAGFDLGRDFGPSAERVLAFDLPEVLNVRSLLSERAEIPKLSSGEVAIPADFRDVTTTLPKTDWPILAIAEGFFDFLDAQSRTRLLGCLAKASRKGKVILLCDGLNSLGSAIDNRNPERFTGERGLPFVGAPRDAVAFHRECGWQTRLSVPLFREMALLIAETRKARGWMRHVPMPGFARRLYALHWLEPSCGRTHD